MWFTKLLKGKFDWCAFGGAGCVGDSDLVGPMVRGTDWGDGQIGGSGSEDIATYDGLAIEVPLEFQCGRTGGNDGEIGGAAEGDGCRFGLGGNFGRNEFDGEFYRVARFRAVIVGDGNGVGTSVGRGGVVE